MAKKRCPSVHSFFPFFSHKAALVLSLLAFTAGMCPVAGNKCDGVAVVLRKGEVGITCPLTADVYQTKHSIMIMHFKGSSKAETVLACDWLSSLNKFDCLRSRVGAELMGIQPDRVLARLPKDRLGDGKYRCQLVPLDSDDPFNDCDICDPEIPTTSGVKTTTTPIPATGANDDYLSSVERNVTFITVTFVLLIVLGCIVLLAVLYRKRDRLRDWWTEVTVHRKPGGVEDSHPTSGPVSILCLGSGNPSDPPQHEEGRPDRPQPDREANQTEGATSGQPLLNPPDPPHHERDRPDRTEPDSEATRIDRATSGDPLSTEETDDPPHHEGDRPDRTEPDSETTEMDRAMSGDPLLTKETETAAGND